RVRARRTADRRLVDVNDLVELIGAQDSVMCPYGVLGQVLRTVAILVSLVSPVANAVTLLQPLLEDIIDQRGFARSAHARDADEHAQREIDVDVLEVVMTRPLDGDALAVAG